MDPGKLSRAAVQWGGLQILMQQIILSRAKDSNSIFLLVFFDSWPSYDYKWNYCCYTVFFCYDDCDSYLHDIYMVDTSRW